MSLRLPFPQSSISFEGTGSAVKEGHWCRSYSDREMRIFKISIEAITKFGEDQCDSKRDE